MCVCVCVRACVCVMHVCAVCESVFIHPRTMSAVAEGCGYHVTSSLMRSVVEIPNDSKYLRDDFLEIRAIIRRQDRHLDGD